MRDIYTAQFEIMSLTKSAEQVASNAFSSAIGWVTGWYDSKAGIKLDLSDTCTLEPQDGHSLTIATNTTERASVRRISWSYPHGDNLLWTVSIQCSRFEGSVDFSLRLMIESTQFFIAPLNFDFGRPRIVPALIREFDCYYGGAHLTAEATMKVASEVPFLVKDRLLSPERRLPIVIISPETITGLPLVDSNEVASTVAGVAEVYVLSDRWASYAFTDAVGKTMACYNGAIRVYWPLGRRTLEAFCPVLMPNIVKDRGTKAISKSLLKDFSSISSFRYIAGPIAEDAELVLRENREREAASLRAAAEARGDFEALAESYRVETLALREDFTKLKARESALLDEATSLRAQAETDQANLRAIYTVTPASLATELAPEPEVKQRSIPEVVDHATASFAKELIFTKNALKTAGETPYAQPERVEEALEAMALVCSTWKQSKEQQISMGSFEEAFDNLGFTYKARASQTSVGKWPEEYEMTYKARRVSIQPHLALGKGGPETCLRIHFHIDETDARFVIDHIGKHKTNLST